MGPTPSPPSDSSARRAVALVRAPVAIFFLYLFLVGIKALETGIGVLGEGLLDGVWESVAHPIAGLAAGILVTAIVQSSSVTTSTIVGLVAAGVLSVGTAIPIVMGANIGTTVTNTLVSLGHLRHAPFFRRAFAAATVHDYFNFLSVLVLLPLEIAFGLITRIATSLERLLSGALPAGGSGDGFVKTAIKVPVSWMRGSVESIGSTDIAGWVLITIAAVLVAGGLRVLTQQMKALISGRIETSFNRLLSTGAGMGAFLAGLALTAIVQSSSITTSLIVPLAAAGVLSLPNAFPMTLGANVGTTVTALLAAAALGSEEALVIALAHLTFNVLGAMVFYPIPRLRRLPLSLAARTADIAANHKSLVAAYVIGVFIIGPLVILVIAST